MASHEAARRAVQAGYTNVSVMVDGIAGWVKMHEPVQHVSIEQAGGGAM
jgi:rhodanese-related sulfurtransferase